MISRTQGSMNRYAEYSFYKWFIYAYLSDFYFGLNELSNEPQTE